MKSGFTNKRFAWIKASAAFFVRPCAILKKKKKIADDLKGREMERYSQVLTNIWRFVSDYPRYLD